MPKLPPSKVATHLGISDKTIVRAVNRGDLRDYQQRDPEVALPMRGPKFILVDLAEAHRYFREKGLLGRIAPSPDFEVVSKLMEELGDVKQELATISALVRESRPSYLTARPAPLDARLLLRPAALSSLSDLPVAADSLSSRPSDFSADSGDSEEVTSDLPVLRTQTDRTKDRMSASSPVLAFGAEKTGRPRTYRGPLTVPLRSEVVFVTSERDLPPGTVRPVQFASQHNVPIGTLKSQIQERRVASHAIQTTMRDHRLERWLTPEDQESVVNHWNYVGTRYKACPDCPHKVGKNRDHGDSET